MKKHRIAILLLITLILLTGCNNNSGQEPAPTSIPLSNPQSGLTDPDITVIPPLHPISLPEGFGITVFAEGLQGPRMMAFGPDQQLYVTEPATGRVLLLPDRNRDGLSDGTEVVAENLIEPSGIAFYQDGSLYVAETTRIFRLGDSDGDGYFQDRETITAGIAAGGYTNRTIIFSPDWRHIYLAIGSSCNVCLEQDERRAGVMRYNADGSEGRIFSTGLRHVIGMAFNPHNDILWAAVMEREGLQEGLPPETIYQIYIDADGGWPYCHAGRIIDPDFGNKDSCGEKLLSPTNELEAQSAPYGLEFYTGDQFPENYDRDLFVALHGTGEGSEASGYKIVRIPFGEGESGLVHDFATGWLSDDGIPWGAPTDLIQGPDGDLFLSDDKLGVIYRIFYVE
jgi:glucose/arabinose dehydrogenase